MHLAAAFNRQNKMQDQSLEQRSQLTKIDGICVLLLIAYFLFFALPARHGGFREDEMFNMWLYWKFGAFKCLLANVMFWTTSDPLGGAFGGLSLYRPAGAFYYLPLYHLFHLDPLPYRVVQISILVLLIPVTYYLTRLLTYSRSVAFLTVLASCYHPALANLAFVGAFIYDVLCGLFYLGALTYYVHLREQNLRLRPGQVLIFLVLYVLALSSKEMAVTLPVIVLSYELLKTPLFTGWRTLGRWIWHCATTPLIAGGVTALYLRAKLYSNSSLVNLDPYRPRYSWQQFVTANAKFVGDLFFAENALTPKALFIVWAAFWIYALLRRDRATRLMAIWVIIVPLPLAFIVPIRGGGCLYLLLFGWAMIFAQAACDVIELISRTFMFPRKTAARGLRIALVSVLAVSFALFQDWESRRLRIVPNFLGVGQKVSHVIAAFDSLDLRPAPNSTVLLKPNEPLFQNKWHSLFIASLIWNDHSLQIWLEGQTKITPEQRSKADYIISLTEFEATMIRSPNAQTTD